MISGQVAIKKQAVKKREEHNVFACNVFANNSKKDHINKIKFQDGDFCFHSSPLEHKQRADNVGTKLNRKVTYSCSKDVKLLKTTADTV